ncbi:FAD-dependent oxidoreductase [Candidatus Saccharibacteria bacterium]|nr:FAD-dependent oxidoreductase [Candidatus Saccharibacteria bacterium]
MYDVAIVGGGPAGLTAAIYTKRANKNVVVFEAVTCGGQILNTSKIENYPAAPHITGVDFGQTLTKQVEDLGADIKYEKVVHISGTYGDFAIKTEDNEYNARVIILACGTTNRQLEIDREDEFTGKGVSYCATCDGGFYKDKDVAVVGGGNTALHEALYLSDICKTVYLIHRREEFRGSEDLVKKVKKKDNIKLVLNSNVVKLNGEKKLNGIETDRNEKYDVDALFVAIGRIPAVAGIVDGLSVDESGFAVADDSCTTNIPGIYIAGDARTKEVRQLVTATSDGAIAASRALDQLKNPTPRDERYGEWLKLYEVAGIGLKENGLSAASIQEKMNMTYQNAVKYIDALEKINVAKIDLKNQFGHGMNITSLDDFPNPDKFDRKEGDDFLEKL